MQLRFEEFDDFIAVNKPFGLRTHRVSNSETSQQLGFVDFLSEKIGKPLYVVHRLDKETSGLIIFAKSVESAKNLSELFLEHKVTKTYFFLTDQRSGKTEFLIQSHIEKVDHFFLNIENKEPNSETHLEFVKQVGSNFLWKASPKTGKSHQIRLHAQKAGIAILGDNEHGGGIFFRLALHAAALEFKLGEKDYALKVATPPIFADEQPRLIEEALYKRSELFDLDSSYRLLHLEVPNLRADIYGNHLWVYDYHVEKMPLRYREQFESFAAERKLTLVIRHMLDRGTGVGGLETKTLATENNSDWSASEEGVTYLFKKTSGFSPGLFLDQRENRKWVHANCENKTVLNLFSYTSGFSVNAALGKAKAVTTVDVSKSFLEWSKENFKLNALAPEKYEFFNQDTILFLKGSVKRNRCWDLIICDPPSFGRSKEGTWKIERDLPELAELLFACLSKAGRILFSCNLEKQAYTEITKLFTKKLKNGSFKIERTPMMSLDFELTDDYANLTKSFFIVKI